MAYDGDPSFICRPYSYDFAQANAVVVSGARLNPCGHMLLNVGGNEGWYFHVAEWIGRPRCMNQSGYQRYIKENEKRELRRTWIPLTDPARAQSKLEELLARDWYWWVIPNNCAAFVETVLQAGGSPSGLYFNCPVAEPFLGAQV